VAVKAVVAVNVAAVRVAVKAAVKAAVGVGAAEAGAVKARPASVRAHRVARQFLTNEAFHAST